MANSINQNEIKKLVMGLIDRKIDFSFDILHNGTQVTCVNQECEYIWDAICHEYSCGDKNELIEVRGLPQCKGNAIEGLTADEVLKMVDETNK